MNPFEIRAEMLKMAQDYLTKQQEINLEFAKDTFVQLVKEGKKVAEDWQEYAPKMYTFEDVLKSHKLRLEGSNPSAATNSIPTDSSQSIKENRSPKQRFRFAHTR